MPQPYFVPVKPSDSRSTQSSGVAGSTSTLSCLPLTLRVITTRLLCDGFGNLLRSSSGSRGIILTYLNRIPAQVNLFEHKLKSADFADYADKKDRRPGAVSRGR